ncbi:MAG: hypothetical protein QXF79_00020 [Ignisphaera sp.]
MSWVVKIIVLPLLHISTKIFDRSSLSLKSIPAVGSSKTIISGLYTRTEAIATRLCSPAEIS